MTRRGLRVGRYKEDELEELRARRNNGRPRPGRIKVFCVVGTRPEAIKMAPVVRALDEMPAIFRVQVCSTGQHRELLRGLLPLLGLRPPDFRLAVMRAGQSLGSLTARCVVRLEDVIQRERPDVVLAQGDTTSTLCAALAAFYNRVPFGHVEAGLRTEQLYSPFPEEANRRLVGPIARWHFAPTAAARRALVAEGVPPRRIITTGNTGIDSLLWMRARMRQSVPPLPRQVVQRIENRRLILSVCRQLLMLARRHPDIVIVYSVHPNPCVKEPVSRILGGHPRIVLVPPFRYDEFVWLLDRSYFVVTDSGGIQEEAPALGKPVLVTRDVTERGEAVTAGAAILVGSDGMGIAEHAEVLLRDASAYSKRARPRFPFGDGRSAGRIATAVARAFRDGSRVGR
jgi:UDP-N-acetylglucosamine 2-epimerase